MSPDTLGEMAMQELERMAEAGRYAPTQVTGAGGGILLGADGTLATHASERLLATSRMARWE